MIDDERYIGRARRSQRRRRKNLKQSSKVIAGNVIRHHFLSDLFVPCFVILFFILSR